MMDEHLIDEVEQHGVIYNRQKYYLSGNGSVANGNSNPYETKEEAWQRIAMKLRSDVDSCKKRWKYLRERYVSQRKQADPPVYEHLSRPYLEKMKFLDQHIQPRKSYRNLPSYLTSPGNSSNYSEYNMDSKSNGSLKNNMHYHTPHQEQHQQQAISALGNAAAAVNALEHNNGIKLEGDQGFREFAAAVASQQLQQITQQTHTAAAAAALAATSQNYQEQFRENSNSATVAAAAAVVASALANDAATQDAATKTPLNSPPPGATPNATSTPTSAQSNSQIPATHANYQQNEAAGSFNGTASGSSSSYGAKRARLHMSTQLNNHNNLNDSPYEDDSDDDTDEKISTLNDMSEHQPNQYHVNASNNAMQRYGGGGGAGVGSNANNASMSNASGSMLPTNADFLFQLYQQLPHQQQQTHMQSQHHQMHHNQHGSAQHHSTQQQQNHQQHGQQTAAASIPPRSSEQLLGELVTSELLGMSKERRRKVQRRILEALYYED